MRSLLTRYSPLVGWAGPDDPDSLLLDITGCAHLFGGEEEMARQIVRDFLARGLAPRIAIADTPGAAWAVARYGSEGYGSAGFGPAGCSRPVVVPAGRLAEALNHLPIEGLRIPSLVVEVLHDLGIQTIEELAALPRETLPCRFGPEIGRRLDQAFGHLPEPIACQPPFELPEASWGCEPPLAGGLAIEMVLKKLLPRLTGPLGSRNEGILQIEVELNVAESGPVRFRVGVVRPTLDLKRLMELAGLQLERVRLLEKNEEGKVGRVKVAVTRSAPLDDEQGALFDLPDRRSDPHDLDSLLNRLSNRLGEEAVLLSKLCPDFEPERGVEYQPVMNHQGGQRPENQYSGQRPEIQYGGIQYGGQGPESQQGDRRRGLKKSRPRPRHRREAKQAAWDGPDAENREWTVPRQRPLRLFPRPQPASVWSVRPDGPPVRLLWNEEDQKIVRFEGPERIETGWWRQPSCRRDYFRVEMENGRRLWLFHSHEEGRWFVHGEF